MQVDPATWINDVTLGIALDADGAVIRESDVFHVDDPVQITVTAAGAPRTLFIRVAWTGPNGEPLGEQTLQPQLGRSYLTFLAPATAQWRPGEYQVGVWVGGRSVFRKPFRVVARSEADGETERLEGGP